MFQDGGQSKKNGAHLFFTKKVVTPEIIVGIAPYLEHRRTLGAPSTFHTWRKWTLVRNLLVLEWCNLGKS